MKSIEKELIFDEKSNLEQEKSHIDYDTQWKEIISNLFEDFIEFFLPEAYPLIDFKEPIVFLEQELHKIVSNNTREGKVINDKLVKVKLKNGSEQWILIHIEVQSSYDGNFVKRMFTYFYRIFDQYDQEITAIAIYTGENIPTKHSKYEYSFLGTKNTYEFNTYITKHVAEKDLQVSSNPFALAVLANKYLYQSQLDFTKRLNFKRQLIQLAKKKNYTNTQIINLLKFIDLILYLPKELEKKFVEETIQTFIKKEDMETLQSREFTNQLHIALYGESIDEYKAKIQKEEEEKRLIDKMLMVQKMLLLGKLEIKEISGMVGLSEEIIHEVQRKMKE